MGCYNDRYDFICRGEAACESESLLEFEKVSLDQVTFLLKKENFEERISWIKLQKVYTKVGIATTHIQDESHPIGQLYKSLLLEPEKYDSLRLIMLAVLLCRGSVEAKSELIFHYFDANESQTLSHSECKQILKLLLSLSCDLLLQLVLSNAKISKPADVPLVTSYIQRLRKHRKAAREELLGELSSAQITADEFTSLLKSTKLRVICCARSLRQFVSDCETDKE